MQQTIRLTLLSALLLLISACSDSDSKSTKILSVDESGFSSLNERPMKRALAELPLGNPSSEQVNGIVFIHEEEKLAFLLCNAFYRIWQTEIFSTLRDSEKSHIGAMEVLGDKYSLELHADLKAAELKHTELQALFDSLLAEGQPSVENALEATAALEELSVIELRVQSQRTAELNDFNLTYSKLLKASRNHLRLIVNQLLQQGISYSPRYLTQREFNDIIDSGIENETE